MRAIVWSLMFVHAAVLASGAAAQSPAQVSPPAAFRVGDAVRVTVWRNPELSGEFQIAEDGTVVHPLYRSIQISGMSAAEAEAAVGRVLQRFEATPEFVVEPLFRVLVGGEVRSPNVYSLPPSVSVVQAVVQAGGPTPEARVDRVRLLRDGEVTYIDLRRPHSELDELRVRSGDQVVLDRRRHPWNDIVRPAITMLGSVASIVMIFTRRF